MFYLILGLLGLVSFILVKQWIKRTPAARVRQQIGWFSLFIAGALFVFLLITGRLAWLWAAAVAALPWVMRAIGTWRIWQRFKSLHNNPDKPDGHRGTKTQDASNQPMTPARAAEILGLKLPTTEQEIVTAHRELMKRNHPDHGGSDYLAQLLNQARETLLDELS